MRKIAVLATAATMAMGSVSAGATIIDLNALSSTGVVQSLAAGNYSIAVIGTADGGAYDAWNAWSSVSGCDAQGKNCATGYLVTYAVDFGAGGTFNQTNGFQVLPNARDIFSTAAAALASFNSLPIRRCDFGASCNPVAGHIVNFTLAAAQDVNFLILDTPYFDNSGGVSLRLTRLSDNAVPEPASWAMLISGFGLVGAMSRRRRALQA